MNDKEIFEKIKSIFSEDGLIEGLLGVSVDGELDLKIKVEKNKSSDDEYIFIKFPETKPKVSVKVISTDLTGVSLGPAGGKLELKNFPDLPFKYKWLKDE